MQNKKNSFQVVVNEHKNHKPFFINIGIYRDLSVQIRQLFDHFRPVKYWSRDRALQNSVCKKHSEAPTLCLNFSFAGQLVFEL